MLTQIGYQSSTAPLSDRQLKPRSSFLHCTDIVSSLRHFRRGSDLHYRPGCAAITRILYPDITSIMRRFMEAVLAARRPLTIHTSLDGIYQFHFPEQSVDENVLCLLWEFRNPALVLSGCALGPHWCRRVWPYWIYGKYIAKLNMSSSTQTMILMSWSLKEEHRVQYRFFAVKLLFHTLEYNP